MILIVGWPGDLWLVPILCFLHDFNIQTACVLMVPQVFQSLPLALESNIQDLIYHQWEEFGS